MAKLIADYGATLQWIERSYRLDADLVNGTTVYLATCLMQRAA